MAFIGSSPKVKRTRFIPQSSDPVSPSEGDFFYSDGTARPEGLWVYTNGAWTLSGSQTGLGVTNYITNNGALSDTSGWATYADAAGTAPVDGTGGSPNVTWQRSNQPLRGTHSFQFSKDAANRQGQGVSYDFGPIDLVDYAGSKLLWVKFDYYATDDITDLLQVYVYDKDNAQLITVYNENNAILLNAPNANQFAGYFFTKQSAQNYRLIIHVRGTSTASKTVYMDNFSVSPDSVQPGAIITEPKSYTPTLTGFGTATNVDFKSWREGSTLVVQGKFTSGTPTATEARASLGFNGLADNVTSSSAIPTIQFAGTGVLNVSSAIQEAILIEPSKTYMTFGFQAGTSAGLTKKNGNGLLGSGEAISFIARFPIEGWAPTVALSTTDALFQNTRLQVSGDPASATSGNPVIFPTQTYLRGAGSYGTGTGLFTVSKSGYYRIHGAIVSANTGVSLFAYVNAVSTVRVGSTDSNGEATFTGTVYAGVGDTISLRPDATLDAASGSVMNIEHMPDFNTFSLYPNVEVITATSSVKTPTATDRYHQLTNNTMTLSAGIWRLQAQASFESSGGSAAYSEVGLSFYSANGADSASVPTALSSASGLTILSVQTATNNADLTAAGDQFRISTSSILVSVTSTVSVFPVSYAKMTTAANARVTVYGNAERVK